MPLSNDNNSPHFEEVKGILLEELAKVARDDNDRLSFDVRPGVTFRGIEVFLGNRIYQLDPKKIETNRALDHLHEYLTHAIQNLRGKTLNPFIPTCYTRSDVLREITFWVVRLLDETFGTQTGTHLVERLCEKIEGRADCKLSEAARYNQLLNELEEELARRLKPQKTLKKKYPTKTQKSCL